MFAYSRRFNILVCGRPPCGRMFWPFQQSAQNIRPQGGLLQTEIPSKLRSSASQKRLPKKVRRRTRKSSAAYPDTLQSGGEIFSHPVRVKACPYAYPFFSLNIRLDRQNCNIGYRHSCISEKSGLWAGLLYTLELSGMTSSQGIWCCRCNLEGRVLGNRGPQLLLSLSLRWHRSCNHGRCDCRKPVGDG